MSEFDLIVFMSRAQGIHNCHFAAIDRAMTMADHVSVIICSTNRPFSIHNPWSADQRRDMVVAHYGDDAPDIRYVDDCLYDQIAWGISMRNTVAETCLDYDLDPATAKIGLIGFNKKMTDTYRLLFPEWHLLHSEFSNSIESTSGDLRQLLFEVGSHPEGWECIAQLVPASVLNFLRAYTASEKYEALARECRIIAEEASSETIVTAESVVVHPAGKVLTVRREGPIGRGLLSLPGGVVRADETAYECCMRLMKDVANMHDPPVTRFHGTRVFDHPLRSNRRREISYAHLFSVTERVSSPESRLGRVAWVDLPERARSRYFVDDHADIITEMCRQLPFIYAAGT